MTRPTRMGLIGAGRIGTVHAGNLAFRIPEADLAAVSDIYPETAQQAAARFGVPTVCDEPAQLFGDPDLDAVLICSSTDTHPRFIVAAAEAGKHVFCEKPIAHDLSDIDRAIAAVERAGVKFQIGFNRRFDANYRRVRQAIVDGEIGTPHLMHIVSRDPAPPPLDYVKVSGGLFMDMTIHDFDMARYLIGAEVTEIYASGAVRVDPAIGEAGDIDTALITLKFENGVMATIDNSRQAVYGYDQRVEVLGSAGAVSTGNDYPNTAVISTAETVRRDLPLNFFMERYTESYLQEIRAFVAAIRNDHPTPVGLQDGRMPVVMALAATQSLNENRPVALSEIV